MPSGDRTGPMGMGPKTGRGKGFCTGNSVPGFMDALPGRGGMGLGRRHGQGFCRGLGSKRGYAFGRAQTSSQSVISYPQTDELSMLKIQAKNYGEALQVLNSRISALEADKK